MENFTNYIQILKISKNIHTRNRNFFKLVWTALCSFVKKPSLFNNNLKELFEVDELHTSLLAHCYDQVDYLYNTAERLEAK